MKLKFLQYALLLLLATGTRFANAQDLAAGLNIGMLELPSIHALMDSAAVNSPLLKMGALQTQVMEGDSRTVRRDWLKNIGIESAYHYGKFGVLSTIENSALTEMNSSLAFARQNTYSAGVYMRIPISDIADRKNKNRISELKIEIAVQELEKLKGELFEQLIIEYNRAQLYIGLLKIKSESMETADLQIVLAEKQFRNGSMNLLEYSSLKDRQAKAASEYLIALSDAKSQLMLLEQICGVKIIH